MEIIKYWLKIYDREFYGYYKYIATMVLIAAGFIVGNQKGMLLLFASCSLHAFHITVMHKLYRCDSFLALSDYYVLKQNSFLIVTILFRTLPIMLFNMMYIFFYINKNILFVLTVSALIYLYSVLIGILIGQLIKFHIVGLSLNILFIILFFIATPEIHSSYLRFFSPILQLYQRNGFQIINLAAILIICFFCGCICFWSTGNMEQTLCLFIAFIAIMFCLLIFEHNEEHEVVTTAVINHCNNLDFIIE